MRSGWRVCVLGLAGLAGCERDPCGPPRDAGDAQVDAAPAPPPPREFVLALDTLTLDTDDDPRVPVFGFDLDGLVSEGSRTQDCAKEDSPSTIDLDQNGPRRDPEARAVDACPVTLSDETGCVVLPPPFYGLPAPVGACIGGVDNQAPVVANVLDTIAAPHPRGVRGALDSHLAQHRGTLLVRVAGVNGEPGPALEDPEIEVQIAAAVPAFASGCDAPGANREYALLRPSLRAGGTSLSDALFSARGRIRAGRVELVAAPEAVLHFDLWASPGEPAAGGVTREQVLRVLGFGPGAPGFHAVQLRFDLGPDGAGSRGNFGGYLLAGELIDAAVPLSVAAGFGRSEVVGIVGGLVDVQVDGICATTGPMSRFGGLGVGYGMTFVPARVATPAVVDAPAPGTCAARP